MKAVESHKKRAALGSLLGRLVLPASGCLEELLEILI